MNNLDVLHPTIGSNGFVTKFDEAKKKRKFRIKVAFKTKVKLMALALLIISLFANYFLLKTFMVLRCSEGGYFMSKARCGDLAQNAFDSKELARQAFVQDNSDLLK